MGFLEHFLNSFLNSQLFHCSLFTLVYFHSRLVREEGSERLIRESIIPLAYGRGDYMTWDRTRDCLDLELQGRRRHTGQEAALVTHHFYCITQPLQSLQTLISLIIGLSRHLKFSVFCQSVEHCFCNCCNKASEYIFTLCHQYSLVMIRA